jgi:hypothetical protein
VEDPLVLRARRAIEDPGRTLECHLVGGGCRPHDDEWNDDRERREPSHDLGPSWSNPGRLTNAPGLRGFA